MEQGAPVKLKDSTVGSFVSQTGPNKILVDIPVERPKYERLNEDTNEVEYFGDRSIATIERIEINLSDVEVNFEEKNKQVDKRNGNWWYTNQHGTRVSPFYDKNGKELP